MLDDKILDRARRLIESRFAERGKALPKEVSRIMRKQQIKKDLYSSHTENLVRAACEEEIRTKAKIVWDSIQEVHKAHGSSITETLRTDLKEEASCHIENAVREASELMERRLRFMKLNLHHLTFESTKREVNKRIGVKVDLYVDLLLCKPAETGQDEKDGQINGCKEDSPNEKSSETWYWKLYEKTIKAVIAAILDKVNPS